MKKRYTDFLKAFWTAFALLQALVICAQTNPDKSLRLFLIGNSFSQNASKYLPELAKEGGYDLTIGRAELPGCPLHKHWELVEAAEANDPKGKAYKGKSLKELLSEGKWDVVTIQQASFLSADITTYRPYAKKLYDFIKKIQPDAEVVFHQTWAYRSDAAGFAQKVKGERVKDDSEMWEKSRAAYHTIASELGMRIIPVGDAFRKITTGKKTAYKKDLKFNAASAVKPALPDQKNSIHVGYHYSGEKLEFDANHANDAGCYLGGLVWYGFLFKTSPSRISFRPKSVDAKFAKQLRSAAKTVLAKQNKN